MDRPYNNAKSVMQMRRTVIELKFLLGSENKNSKNIFKNK